MDGRPIRLLLFGASGQLGRELSRRALPHEFVVRAMTRDLADFTNSLEVAAALRNAEIPDLVINAAAYTDTDRAEIEPEIAWRVNAQSVGALAQECAKLAVPLLHLSSDYVFDGAKTSPYREEDLVNPLSVYGQTKWAGEEVLRSEWSRHIIVRTSWVFSPYRTNFVKTMLRLGAERDDVAVVDDQWGGPTSAADLAQCLLMMAKAIYSDPQASKFGTFHYCGRDFTTRYRFAREIFAKAGKRPGGLPRLRPIASAEYPTPAHRPKNARLDCTKIERIFGIQPALWSSALDQVLSELEAQSAGNER